METKGQQSKQSLQQSPTDGAVFFQAIKEKASTSDETLIGRGDLDQALANIEHYGGHGNELTPQQAWFGVNIRTAMRQDEPATTAKIKEMFKFVLLEMNVDHPWTNAKLGDKQVARLIEFDPTWTLEDFAVFFDMMARGRLGNHYGRPSRQWIEECQVAYNGLKFDAREEIAARAKVKAEADRLTAMDPQWSGHVSRKPRTMAEFLGGKNHLSAADRAELAQRDKERHAKG